MEKHIAPELRHMMTMLNQREETKREETKATLILRGGDGNMDVGDVVYTRMTMLYDVKGR